MPTDIDDSQRKAAIVVGVAYLLTMAASIFDDGYMRPTLITPDAAVTAQNLIAHPGLFRLAIGLEIAVFVSDTTLIAALARLTADAHVTQ